jgi:hypothetical protein
MTAQVFRSSQMRLYRTSLTFKICGVVHRDWIFFWLSGVAVAGLWAGIAFLSSSARLERRRRKSHSRIKAKANRPMIRFSVRPPKKK